MFGREPTTLLASLVRDQHTIVDVVPFTNDAVRAMVGHLAVAVDVMHKQVTHRVQAVRAVSRRRESNWVLPNFAVGDYVLMARVRSPGKTSKMVSTWTGPWRVTNAEQARTSTKSRTLLAATSPMPTSRGSSSTRFLARKSSNISKRRSTTFSTNGNYTSKSCLVSGAPPMGPTRRWYSGTAFRNPRNRGSL